MTSPSLISATVWYDSSPTTVGGNRSVFSATPKRHLGMKPTRAEPAGPKVCPNARTDAHHGGVKVSSVTCRKLRIVLTYAKHSSARA